MKKETKSVASEQQQKMNLYTSHSRLLNRSFPFYMSHQLLMCLIEYSGASNHLYPQNKQVLYLYNHISL